jgi:hypothetical protein
METGLGNRARHSFTAYGLSAYSCIRMDGDSGVVYGEPVNRAGGEHLPP